MLPRMWAGNERNKMNTIHPFKLDIQYMKRCDIRCAVCSTEFEYAKTRVKDTVFICARCRAEINGVERVKQDNQGNGNEQTMGHGAIM